MSLKDELQRYVDSTFRANWSFRDGNAIPDPEDVSLENTAVRFARATILYADLAGSTNMVTEFDWQFASEIYKNYLYCCSRLIRSEGGEITAYDGDRVMGVFIGDRQSSPAAKCALKINYAVREIINPAIKKQYNTAFHVAQCVGIDVSEIRAARTGVRGDNDLVWVGRAANYAAKLTELSSEASTWCTEAVYNRLSEDLKYTKGEAMWEQRSLAPMGTIYSSSWQWPI